MSLGGSRPSEPEKPQPTETEIALARISAEKWNDFIDRYTPVEATMRDRVSALDTDAAYQRAIAQATNNAAMQAGRGINSAVQQMAGGGNGAAYNAAMLSANEMAAKGIASQYAAQRANYLNQAKGLAELGSGISGQGMGAFKSSSDYARSDANRLYADKVGANLASASQRLGTLNALGNLAMNKGVQTSISNFGEDMADRYKMSGNQGYTGSTW